MVGGVAACCVALAVVVLVAAGITRRASAGDGGASVRLRSATIHYHQTVPGDPVVEVRIVLENGAPRATNSTSILWDPSFHERFVFLSSDPPAWRVRTVDGGWASLDTSGLLPSQRGTYRLWFAAGSPAVHEPRVKVVVDGQTQVADLVAEATHVRQQAPRPTQRMFERGAIAMAADVASVLPITPRMVLMYAIAVGLALTAIVVIGGSSVLREASDA